MPNIPFSRQLENWLKSSKPKTIAGLMDTTAEKSFAIIFLVMMSISALPLPTGGFTTIFEIITMLSALQLIAGRKTIWLPQKLLHRKLGKNLEKQGLPYLIKKIRWVEKYARPRMSQSLENREALRLMGLMVLLFTLGSFFAPPFSGLDTLPALGVVAISLGILLEDISLVIGGVVVGAIGILVEVTLGAAIVELFKRGWQNIYS